MATSLASKSNSAVAMAFGMAVQSTPGTLPVGTITVLCDELSRRGLLHDLLHELGAERARVITLAMAVDRSRMRRSRAG